MPPSFYKGGERKEAQEVCRLLKAEEIECRVAQVTAKGCSLLLYKTARVDRAILDEEFSPLGWQNDFKVIDGKMYGGIGVSRNSNGVSEWIWKWDCGTESQTEQEKGQASDCFKRAGFKWGIGIELYSAPFIWVNEPTEMVNNKYKLVDKYQKYSVKSIDYDENRNIVKLVITDKNGNKVFELGKNKAPENPTIDKDMDLFAGLEACSDIENLKTYWKENRPKVKNKKAFDELKDKLKEGMYV